MEERILATALTFDDVLLVPQRSSVIPTQVDVTTRFSRRVGLNIPIVSAAMDTVTESEMAIALARLGGIGVIHKNLAPVDQAREVTRVKRSVNGVINDPVTLTPDAPLSLARELMEMHRISGIPIVAAEGNGDGGAPLVVKLLEGTQGVGVILAETKKAAQAVIEAFRGLDANILVQEFIKEAGGTDIRAIVVGGKVVAAMKRTGAEGDFRSNLHRGGSAQVVRLSSEERATAVRAAKSMGLNACGVDMLRANHGPVIMEVNSSPGLEGVEKATGKDIAGMMIEYLEKNAKTGKTKTKGKG